jgi:hypothetical protein
LTGSLTGAGYLITTNNNFAANTITVNSALLGNVSVVGTTVSAIDSYGAPQTLTVDGNLTVSGVINAGIESVATYTLGSSNTASINAVSSPIAYAQSLTSNITADFAIPTALSTNGRVATYVVVVAQGSTPYIINAVKVNTVTQTISWQGGSAPTGNANKKDVFSFTLMRLSGSWVVLGSMNTYG